MNVLNSNVMSFYHPTKVVFLDDNQGFLDAMALELHEQENILMFTNPEMAMQLIKTSNENMLQHTTIGVCGAMEQPTDLRITPAFLTACLS